MSPVMKLFGAKATSRPCRIQTSPTMSRMIAAALLRSRIDLDILSAVGE
jgi:hypothetical protein